GATVLASTGRLSLAATVLKDRANQEMRWPVNADVVDGLVSCLDKSYVEAYSSVCREKGQ
ncbi:hypothetical protein BRM01_23720, partial [Xanthomonas oryzae pv. oryzae]